MSKQGINHACISAHGARPHFYKDEDVVNLRKILSATPVYAEKIKESGLVISDLMYTYHPPVDIAPIPKELQVSKADSYGFYRLGLLEAFIRPHLNNVKSCHKYIINNDRAKAPGGNLNYLANPFWGTYGIYDGSGKMAVVAEDNSIEGVNLEDYIKDTRNLLATVNVAIGYDPRTGLPTAYFSRVYGVNKDTKVSDNPYVLRLLDYFRYTLGYAVYVATEWVGTVRGKDSQPYKFTDSGGREFITPVTPALIHAKLGVNACQVKRYRDIQDQHAYLYDGKMYLQERLSSVAYASTRNSVESIKSNLLDVGKSTHYGEEVLESGTRTKICYKLLYDKPEPCSHCGGYSDAVHSLMGGDYEPISLCERCVTKYLTVEADHPVTGDVVTLYVTKDRVTFLVTEQGYTETRLDYELEDGYTLATEEMCYQMGAPVLINSLRKYKKIAFHKDAFIKGILYSADGGYKVTTKEILATKRTSLSNEYNVVTANSMVWYALCKYAILGETKLTADEFNNRSNYGFNRDVSYLIKNRGGAIPSATDTSNISLYCFEYGHRMAFPTLTLADNVEINGLEGYNVTITVTFSTTTARQLDFVATVSKGEHTTTIKWVDNLASSDKITSVYSHSDIVMMVTTICNCFNLSKVVSIDAGVPRNYAASSDTRFFRSRDAVIARSTAFKVVKKPLTEGEVEDIQAITNIVATREEQISKLSAFDEAVMLEYIKPVKRKPSATKIVDMGAEQDFNWGTVVLEEQV